MTSSDSRVFPKELLRKEADCVMLLVNTAVNIEPQAGLRLGYF